METGRNVGGRPVLPHPNKARIDAVLKHVKDEFGVRMDPFVIPGSKNRAALFGDMYVSATVANDAKSQDQMRRYYRSRSDATYPISAHVFAAGGPGERVEMSLDSFVEIMRRLIESQPEHYFRKPKSEKDVD